MGKIVRGVLKVAAIAVNFIPGIGQIASLAITAGLSLLDAALAPKSPRVSSTMRERLFATIDPSTPRKMAFGTTALATDIRYEEYGGTDQEYLDRIIVVAAHKITSVDEIWIDDRLAWSLAGGVQAAFSGYLWVDVRLEGTAANTIAINGGSKWGTSRRLTGCAYVRMRHKLTGNSKKAESPFAQGVSQRLTIRGRGCPIYDPRLDSSIGGSGPMRANDQTTWGWPSDAAGNNPILQTLTYQLGWRINGRLSVGRGIPPKRLDLIAAQPAASLCEEAVTLAAGGTEPRYRSGIVVSEADPATSVYEMLLATCAGTLRDEGGKLALHVLHNDLAVPVAHFSDDDVLDDFTWGVAGDGDDFNVVRGRFTDPSNNALYQLVDYPEVRIASPDGQDRVHPFDLAAVQSASQAQRLAKQELQRAQFRGVFGATFKATGLRARVGDVVTLTFSATGFVSKLFRVIEQTISMDGTVGMVLREENAAIYAWSNEESPAVVAAAPTVFDPLNSPLITAIADAAAEPPTNRDPVRPVEPIVGLLWQDISNGREQRFGGLSITTDGGDLTTDGGAVQTDGYVLHRDFGIDIAQATADSAIGRVNVLESDVDALAAAVLAIDDDDILSISEKIEVLRPAAAAFEALWTANSALAATAGVSTTAAATKRTAWLSYLASISPDWDDVTAASSITRGALDVARDEYDAALKDLARAATEAITAAQQARHEVNVSALVFQANHLGAVQAGQLPREFRVKRWRGMTDVSDSATWSIVSQSGITGATVTVAGGLVTVPSAATIALTGAVVVKSVLAGVELTSTVSFTRSDAAPPATGGGGGGTTVNDPNLNSVSSTSFVAVSDLMTVRTGSAGQLAFASGSISTSVIGADVGTYEVEIEWRRRPVGGSWTAMTAAQSNPDAETVNVGTLFEPEYEQIAGIVVSNPTATGLAANTDFEVQLFGRRTSSINPKDVYLTGTVSVTGS